MTILSLNRFIKMADISAFNDIWGIEAKTAIFEAWDPEKPRDTQGLR